MKCQRTLSADERPLFFLELLDVVFADIDDAGGESIPYTIDRECLRHGHERHFGGLSASPKTRSDDPSPYVFEAFGNHLNQAG